MYDSHSLELYTMYDSHNLELYTMYDSHGIYLHVLWTICMYKFSKCHVLFFTYFSFHLPILAKITWFLAKFARKSSRRFSGKNIDLLVKPADLSVK
jgi:hypothetical protein